MLISCYECGHKVSTEALACPKCGAPPRVTITCHECGETVAADAKACPSCGAPPQAQQLADIDNPTGESVHSAKDESIKDNELYAGNTRDRIYEDKRLSEKSQPPRKIEDEVSLTKAHPYEEYLLDEANNSNSLPLWRRLTTFQGRIGRLDYFIGWLLSTTVFWVSFFVFYVIADGTRASEPMPLIFYPIFCVWILDAFMWVSLTVRRLRDLDCSGWLAFLLMCIPGIGFVTVIVAFVAASSPSIRYGTHRTDLFPELKKYVADLFSGLKK
ncbi:MAG: zinc-ribbon domain-containing protein [Roseibacillus sp.]|nr:zinc-ribbon domain-containing protein [Roseibacillus sp.]